MATNPAYAIIALVSQLLIQLLIAFLIWQHYSDAKYPLSKRYSTFWPRFFEGDIDALIFYPFQLLTALLTFLHGAPVVMLSVMLVQQLAYWTYSVGMHAKYGQTVGKMVCKVKILDAKTETPISFKQALLRDIIPIVISILALPSTIKESMTPYFQRGPQWNAQDTVLASISGFWFLLEVITMLTNDKRRALHDFIAGTVVVRTTAGDIPEATTPPGTVNVPNGI